MASTYLKPLELTDEEWSTLELWARRPKPNSKSPTFDRWIPPNVDVFRPTRWRIWLRVQRRYVHQSSGG